MIAKLFDIKETELRGKGLFAKEYIPIGTVICFECCDCKEFSEQKYNEMSKEEQEIFSEHAYRRKDGSFLMPCDETKILNHSCNSNILDTGKGFDIVVRDIQKGEEATYDYRVFYDNLSMPCLCGEKSCCKIVTCQHPVLGDLQKFWREKIYFAFLSSDQVVQPFKNIFCVIKKNFKL